MNYFEVVPLTYIGTDTSVLTYSYLGDLDCGQAVTIPLRNKKLVGIVTGKVKKPAFATKGIVEKIETRPILSPKYLELAHFISNYYGASLSSVFQTMIPAGLRKKRRDMRKEKDIAESLEKSHKLTNEQKKILEDITNSKNKKPNLIFGITGSGKTEIYLQLTEKMIQSGKQTIILVPEVSLTPQTLSRFKARFGDKVTMLHSYLKETERYRNWKEVFDGQKQVIVGSRSALFAPCQNLGLIVIDEEHETSYKQDQNPRYHATLVAEKIAEIHDATLVLASATPSITSYHAALCGDYNLHMIQKRIVQDELPSIEVVDMRNEFKKKNYSIFSDSLQDEIKATLANKKQVLLFLNRRGMATFVNCRDCGYTATCPNCETALTFHYHTLDLTCHHCNYHAPIPTVCPSCKSMAIKYFGSGTQKVEYELKKLFGNDVRIARMDKDTTRERESHETIFRAFAGHKIDILVGTQMITKGWDLPNVDLVGIISADTMINFPDFYAAEKTFDLLTQVAGRTGRGSNQGKVVLQTYSPEHPAICYAKDHDFIGFYTEEIKNRREFSYPPFASLIKLMYNNVVQERAEETCAELYEKIHKQCPEIKILGPSPSFLPKLAGKYRWQIILQIIDKNEHERIEITKQLTKLANNDWTIDVDPISTI